LRGVLRRGFNENQLIILRELSSYDYRSLTHALRSISRKYGIPLSTLKTNTKILKELGIIEINKGKTPKITQIGKVIAELLNTRQFNGLDLDPRTLNELSEKADLARRYVLKMVAEAGAGHIGASLSVVDILITLYLCKLRYDVRNPDWPLRDRLILSKGHAAPALYAVLSIVGFIPEDELWRFRDIEGVLQGHPEVGIPGVDMVSGSLGQGLSVGCGMALALKRDGIPAKVYVIVGDGELDEGQVWEAALTASKLGLDNLVVIVDRNSYQQEGPTEHVKPLEPLAMKWFSFGWYVVEVDGHDFRQLLEALNEVDGVGKPSVIIAHTVKGRGFPPAEGNNIYHSRPVSKDELRSFGVLI
jgi:transketolase